MELKKYQSDVLKDLDSYIEVLNEKNDLFKAYRAYWEAKGVNILESSSLHPYDNTIKGVPNVTIKVPTAGGKTFIACKSLKHIFRGITSNTPKLVVWVVPSEPILKQTYENLSNQQHPYRHAIDVDFGGKVNVLDIEAAQNNENMSPAQLKENLTIYVLSVQSLASKTKEGRRARRENEKLVEHVAAYQDNKRLVNADESSLLQVLSQYSPVVIVDESHNFQADLRIDLLQEINPRFIFNLTATPRQNSNIISFVDALLLKKANMVKLPVIVYNHRDKDEVVLNAIKLRNSLEKKAIEQEKSGGHYIRPIVLFQAQPQIGEGNETFDEIKKQLISRGIPEEQVKIKTAEINEIKNMNLLDPSCVVRYIITVNALKEGWDCPFAYILASLANKKSKIDVEQILGRVLRLPYTTRQQNELLNLSYVFTCSSDFNDALQDIIKSLNHAGYSKKDFRVAENEEVISSNNLSGERTLFTTTNEQNGFDFKPSEHRKESFSDFVKRNSTLQGNAEYSAEDPTDDISAIEEAAIKQSEDYNNSINEEDERNNSSVDDMGNDRYSIFDSLLAEASQVRLPRFVQKVQNPSSNLFGDTKGYSVIEPSDLLEGINLDLEDHKIDFTRTATEIAQVDLDQNSAVPVHNRVNAQILASLREQLRTLPSEAKKHQFIKSIVNILNFKELNNKSVENYISVCLANKSNEELDDLIANNIETTSAIKRKLKSIMFNYEYKKFKEWLDTERIQLSMDDCYTFPKYIVVTKKMVGLSKGLYEEEEEMNKFEYQVASDIANEDNVLFWHRNQERGKGYYINGFINHYPDFIVQLKSGQTLLIETKGEQLANDDSKYKIELGRLWASSAGESYRYYMVFDSKKVDGAITVKELISKIRMLGENDKL